jgi:hypothetical protein
MKHSTLALVRDQILAFRRRTGFLDERMPKSAASLRRAAWAGLQDSMPRAAVLSLHARVEDVEPFTWEDPSLAQLWGPRYSTYVVPQCDFALFSIGRLPDRGAARARAEQMAERLVAHLGDRRLPDREVHAALGIGNAIKYAAPTGRIAIRWEGARAPVIWAVPAPGVAPADARRELARRYLHVFGPSTADRFSRWAGISRREGAAAFAGLEHELLAVRTPLGDEWLLAQDEATMRSSAATPAPARLLPSGDAYFLLDGAERALLVPDPGRRALLWTPRVWPGALLVDGEVCGTWRRAQHVVRVAPWTRLPPHARAAVEDEARSLPLPLDRQLEVVWE